MEPPALVGTQLGCYDIQTLLGSGGMAHVYQGLDQNLQRPVAIKVLSQEAAAQPGFAERFRQEARMIAGLHHPHIVQVYNFGQQDDYTYMVQELLPGPTLEQYLHDLAARDRLLDRQDIISIVSQVASALDAAHAAGIVHRDVKPANMLWNTAGALVLTDFGVARHILNENNPVQTGTIIGTPYYLSPEQACSLAGTHASDIYALGVLIYQLVAGRVPFVGDTQETVLYQHVHAPPPPLHTLRPDVLHAVEDVVQRALAKDPAARFASAGELARALKHAWPPAFGRVERDPANESLESVLHLWRTGHFGVVSQNGHHNRAVSIHSQKTIVAIQEVQPPAETRQPQAVPAAQPAPAISRSPAMQSAPTRRHILPLILSTLLVLIIVGATIFELERDYQRQAVIASQAEQVTPTTVPTAQLLLTTSIPTPIPTTVAIQPTSTAAPAAAPETGLKVPTVPSEIEPVAFTTLPGTDSLSQTGQFARLRALIEVESSDGWARIDREAWLSRLDDIQGAVERGEMQQAAAWLDEMRQMLLHHVNDERTSDVANQMVSNIEAIAAHHNIVLPSLTRPAGDDS